MFKSEAATHGLTLELAYRLRTTAAPHRQQQVHRRQQSRWNGNGQGATNDSAEYKAAVRIVDGFPVEYSCLEDPRETGINEINVRHLNATFDYEMLTRKNAFVEKSMRSLEWSLLWNVARNLGLHNCNYRKQDPLFGTRRRLAFKENYIVGLSSLDVDKIDSETSKSLGHVECQLTQVFCVGVSSNTHLFLYFSSESCTVLSKEVDESTICTPMIGSMTAQFIGDEDTIKRYLDLHIENEMNSKRVRIEEVKEARYVGDRDSLWPNANMIETLDSKNNSTNLALVFGVLAGVFMLCFALLMARGRKQRQDAGLDSDTPLPGPIPAVIFRPKEQLNGGIQPTSSGDTEESVPDKNDMPYEDDRKTDLQPVSITSIVSRNAPLSIAQQKQSTDCANQASGTTSEAATVDKKKVDSPHLPPVYVVPVDSAIHAPKEPTKSSKTLQTRRKRKKKKKKKVLKRVSSKQSINEMETINEMDEGGVDDDDEGSEFDGSEYSEYSTDDEDDGLLMVHTPTDTWSQNAASPKISPGPMIPPSPIREEPRIRRLPPPWI